MMIRSMNRFFAHTAFSVRPRQNPALLALFGITSLMAFPFSTSAQDAPEFTGVVIDVRSLTTIERSMSPVVIGPAPASETIYPDASCVPTPEEVQEQSVVRYYHTEEDAEKGVAGNHPLIITAEEVVGPNHESVRISAADADRLKTLDKTLHFTRTWKVAFLLPEEK